MVTYSWRQDCIYETRILREILPFFFKKFRNSKQFWQQRYFWGGNSGKGSYGTEARFKAETLNKLIKNYNIKTVIDLGCGDGHNALFYEVNQYIGFDVSKDAIAICQKRFSNHPSFHFYEINIRNLGKIERQKHTLSPVLVISFDVIFHLVEDEIYDEYLARLEQLSENYSLIYSTDFDAKASQAHVRHRNFSKDLLNKGLIEIEDERQLNGEKHMKLFIRPT